MVFESYFGHHKKFIILLFIVCGFCVGRTFLLTNVLWDVILCFPCPLDGLHKNHPYNKQEINHTQKNTTRTKTFDKQHQHHDEHADTQNKDTMIHKNDQNDHHNRHDTE